MFGRQNLTKCLGSCKISLDIMYKSGRGLESQGSGHSLNLRDPIIVAVARIVDDLQKALGPNAEVVLYDLENLHDGVIAISGNVTGRKVGAPVTNLLLRLLKSGSTNGNLTNYRTLAPNGSKLRSSTLFLYSGRGQAVGCLCLNFDITHTVALKELLENELGVQPRDLWNKDIIEELFERGIEETFDQNIEDTLQKVIDDAVRSSGHPVKTFSKGDRVKLVKALDDKGIFRIKSSVPIVAGRLGVSRATVYNYINQARGRV